MAAAAAVAAAATTAAATATNYNTHVMIYIRGRQPLNQHGPYFFPIFHHFFQIFKN